MVVSLAVVSFAVVSAMVSSLKGRAQDALRGHRHARGYYPRNRTTLRSMTMMRLVIDSQLSEIRRATELVDAFRAHHGLGDEDANAIHIVVDEILSNAIRHGLGGAASHSIAVTLDLSAGEIRVE